jgi:hypothetical protein
LANLIGGAYCCPLRRDVKAMRKAAEAITREYHEWKAR